MFVQVQCQLFCSGKKYCDFIVWTKEDIFVERIHKDDAFWTMNIPRAENFFRTAIMPEIIGRFYSHPSGVQSVDTSSPPAADNGYQTPKEQRSSTSVEDVYCYCQRPEEGDMVACDNSTCPHAWFHVSCLGLKSLPSSRTWYCPDCRKLPEFSRKKRKTATHS